ncbi:BatD family protein [uncultured Halopseudomonas sp.]|uniref:BatD family protein n=1 Tax=uncultured Halopseudomonas sp. TaxID=2901193 RepID=UPI0030EBA118|tara:strand:- start:26506 stop:28173 length:1668 start_codon:yes stop_codon:yes gene_type:complete
MIRLILWLCILIFSVPAGAALEASVDRTRLIEGETLELTLETEAANRFNLPELAPLEEHFAIQNSRQLSLVSQLDGKTQPVTRWVITLLPKRTGYVVIPPLSVDTLSSDPISLQVLTSSEAARDNTAQMAPVFIDAEVDTETPYVQAQVLLTLRVYHSVSLYDDSTLTGLDFPDARVESLGPPRNYERLINGIRHGVIEVRYAIFPQRSGELEVPSQLFTATTMPSRSADSALSRGRLVQVRSPGINLQVRPIPPNYPPGAPWLPATDLSLSQSWQPDPGLDLLAGESLTRTLTVTAEGLNASQLPELSSLGEAAITGLREYTDQPELENSVVDNGIRGLRQDSAALLVQQAGAFQIPALRLYWWDTASDSLRETQLDPIALNVMSSQSFAAAAPPASVQASEEFLVSPLLWPWQLASALLGLALIISLGALWRLRGVLQRLNNPYQDEEIFDEEIQGNPLTDLQSACRTNQPAEARKALETWARQQDSEGLIGLTHLHPELAEALDELNACLFGQAEHNWRGKPLWRAVRMVVQSRKRQSEALEPALDSLYPKV